MPFSVALFAMENVDSVHTVLCIVISVNSSVPDPKVKSNLHCPRVLRGRTRAGSLQDGPSRTARW